MQNEFKLVVTAVSNKVPSNEVALKTIILSRKGEPIEATLETIKENTDDYGFITVLVLSKINGFI